MKHRTNQLLAAIILGAVVPMIFFRIAQARLLEHEDMTEPTEALQTEETQMGTHKIPVLQTDGTIQMMELDTYISGVVLAEMPAEFEPEALKAQAVVARTYALKRVTSGNKHEQQAVCTDPACCQAYKTADDFLAGASAELLQKVRTAVVATEGQVLLYNGALIEATYFSCSGGRTEDAQSVWGQQIPYLQSVDSPGEEHATHYIDTVSFSVDEFCQLIGQELSDTAQERIGEVTYTAGGGVATIIICGKKYTGTQLRQLLGLYSTAFVITAAGDRITITTKGYGHRVGMSQYGAEAMAVSGSKYTEILSHYYPGTTIEKWEGI